MLSSKQCNKPMTNTKKEQDCLTLHELEKKIMECLNCLTLRTMSMLGQLSFCWLEILLSVFSNMSSYLMYCCVLVIISSVRIKCNWAVESLSSVLKINCQVVTELCWVQMMCCGVLLSLFSLIVIFCLVLYSLCHTSKLLSGTIIMFSWDKLNGTIMFSA